MLNSEIALDAAFRALGDGARRSILERLSRGEATISEIATPLSITLSAVHQHVAVLEEAGFVVCEKRGRSRWCRLEPAGFTRVESWIGDRKRLWNAKLGALARLLASEQPRPRKKGGKT